MRSTATSRMAASGGTREAFSAGMIDVNTLTPMPTTNAQYTVLALEHQARGWCAEPDEPEQPFQQDSDAETDEQPDDRSHDANKEGFADNGKQHLPAAPRRVRGSNAISRVRCATMIENVL